MAQNLSNDGTVSQTTALRRRTHFDETEGNAFFVVEVLRDLAESGAIGGAVAQQEPDIAAGRLAVPEGVKDVITHRVARLGPGTSRLLATATVLGREFELDVLQRLSELDEDELVNRLESAVRAHVIEELAGAAGRHTFAHALIRDTLYGGLTATRRAILHRRAAAALEEAHDAELESHLAELAYHFAQAGSTTDLAKAIEYGTRAGDYAISQLAYEKAATHFRQAAELIAATDRPRHCDLVIAQGEAERQAGDPAYRQTLLNGARLAQNLHDPDRLARAALANNRGVFSSSAQGVDRDRVSVLHQALAAYDIVDSPTRAALLVLLAVELVKEDDWQLRESLSDDAVAMARRVGDLRTLALVLTQRPVAQWRPETLADRQADIREAGELADRLEDPLLAGHAAFLGALAAMEAGDLERSDRLLARLAAVADKLGQPMMRWYAVTASATRCCIGGHVDEAERLASGALALGRSAGQPDSLLWMLGPLLVARFLHGSLDSGEPRLPDLIESPGSSPQASPEIKSSRSLPLALGAAMSLVLCEVGRVDDARRHFELLMSSGLDTLPHDHLGLAIPALASVACGRLGDGRSAIRLHAILEPHSHRLVTAGSAWLGAATHYLGLLASTLDRHDEADVRFAAAERSYISLGAEPWLARLRSDWAAALLTRRRGSDKRRAEQLLERAAAYRRLARTGGEHADTR